MKSASYWIEQLKLTAHPEGGFFRETYRSEETIQGVALPERFGNARNFSTSIFFLLRSQDHSKFHKIKSDELWHFHAGTSLTIFVLTNSGLTIHRLGPDPDEGDSLQVVIPANCWFGAKVIQPDSYTLAGCTVSPGFDFSDFQLADRDQLLKSYPDQKPIIEQLT